MSDYDPYKPPEVHVEDPVIEKKNLVWAPLANALLMFTSERRCLHDHMADTIVIAAARRQHARRYAQPTPALPGQPAPGHQAGRGFVAMVETGQGDLHS